MHFFRNYFNLKLAKFNLGFATVLITWTGCSGFISPHSMRRLFLQSSVELVCEVGGLFCIAHTHADTRGRSTPKLSILSSLLVTTACFYFVLPGQDPFVPPTPSGNSRLALRSIFTFPSLSMSESTHFENQHVFFSPHTLDHRPWCLRSMCYRPRKCTSQQSQQLSQSQGLKPPAHRCILFYRLPVFLSEL